MNTQGASPDNQIIEIHDLRVASFIPEGEQRPSQVHLLLVIPGLASVPIVMRIKSRAALNSLVSALMEHGDEVFAP